MTVEHELSENQKALWLLQKTRPSDPWYIVSRAHRLRGVVNFAALEAAVSDVCQRHAVLRTRIRSNGAEDRAVLVAEPPDFAVIDLEASVTASPKLVRQLAATAFALDGPLLRVRALREADGSCVLVLNVHHVIFDGWSLRVWYSDLSRAYKRRLGGGPAPEALPFQFYDFQHWHDRQSWAPKLQRAQRVHRDAPVFALPLERARHAADGSRGGRATQTLSVELVEALDDRARERGVSLNALMLTLFAWCLGRYADSSEVVVGMPVANRRGTAHLIGYFANVVPVRILVSKRVQLVNAIAHTASCLELARDSEEVPFETLVRELRVRREAGVNPLFQIAYAFQNAHSDGPELPQVDIEPVLDESLEVPARFDMEVHFWTSESGAITIEAVYAAELLGRDAMTALIDGLVRVVERVAAGSVSVLEPALLVAPQGAAIEAPKAVPRSLVQRRRSAPSARTRLAVRRLCEWHDAEGATVFLPAADLDACLLLFEAAWYAQVPVVVDQAVDGAGEVRERVCVLPRTGLGRAEEQPWDALFVDEANVRPVSDVDVAGRASAASVGTGFSLRVGPCYSVASAESLRERVARMADCFDPDRRIATAPSLLSLTFPLAAFSAVFLGSRVVSSLSCTPGTENTTWLLADHELGAKGPISEAIAAGDRIVVHGTSPRGPVVPTRAAECSRWIFCSHACAELAYSTLNTSRAEVTEAFEPLLPVQIRDKEGDVVPTGFAGTIHVKQSASSMLHDAEGRDAATWVDTGRPGLLSPSGRLRFFESARPDVEVLAGVPFARSSIERVLREQPTIHVCAVLPEPHALICYLEVSAPIDRAALFDVVRPWLPSCTVPVHFVALSSLAATSGGELDEEALRRVAVHDPNTALGRYPQARILRLWRHNGAAERVPFPVFQAPQLDAPVPASAVNGVASALAEVSGGSPSSDLPASLIDAVPGKLQQLGRQRLIFIDATGDTRMVSYERFFAKVRYHAQALIEHGVQPRERVAICFRSNEQFLTAFWSLLTIGAVPILVAAPSNARDAQRVNDALQFCDVRLWLTEAGVAATLDEVPASHRALPARIVLEEALASTQAAMLPANSDDVALILLTSGSTGRPKRVALTHRNVLSMIAGTKRAHAMCSDDVSLNWMPMDHVGGIVFFHLRDACLGAKQLHVAKEYVMASPLRWLELMERHRVTVTWAPNSAYAMLNRSLEESPPAAMDLGCIRMLLNGGEAVVSKTARTTLRLLRAHGLRSDAMVPVWGMSETSSGVIFSSDFDLEATSDGDTFVAVGRPLPGLEVRIVDLRGELVPEGVPGSLAVRGECVFRGYEGDPVLTDESFVAGWFMTGDLAVIQQGRITIVGREKDVIILNGVNRNAREFELPASEVDGVNPDLCVACGVPDARSGSEHLTFFVALEADTPRGPAEIADEIRQKVFAATGVAPHTVIRLNRADFPMTEIGKIQRAILVQRMREGNYAGRSLSGDRVSSATTETLPDCIYRVALQTRSLRTTSSPSSSPMLLIDGWGAPEAASESLPPGTIRVRYGAGPDDADGARRYVDPFAGGAFEKLLTALNERAQGGLQVIDRSFVEAGEGVPDTPRRIAALSRLIAALEASGITTSLSVLAHAARHDSARWGVGALRGFVRAAREECQHVRSTLIEFEAFVPSDAIALARKEDHSGAADPVVQYRGRTRRVPRLDKVWCGPSVRQGTPFEARGLYVVTGPLGGIGSQVARLLAGRWQAKLLLLGRVGGASSETRQREVRELLRPLGESQTLYREVRFDAEDQLAGAIDEAERHFGRSLCGVVHTAGTYKPGNVSECDADLLSAQFEAQVAGALAFEPILAKRPTASFLAFGSINGYFAAPNTAAYCAATTALAAICERFENDTRKVHCLGSTRWRDTGLARVHGSDNAVKSAGFEVLESEEGLRAMQLVAMEPSGFYLVGVNGKHARMRKYSEPGGNQEQCVALESTLEMTHLDRPRRELRMVEDAVGREVQLETWLCSPTVYKAALENPTSIAALSHGTPHAGPVSLTAMEVRLAEIWGKLLGGAAVGRDSNFFEIGGDSLQGSQVVARIRGEYGIDVPLDKIFDLPRLRELAAYVESSVRLRGQSAIAS